jgi:hypothetical protein
MRCVGNDDSFLGEFLEDAVRAMNRAIVTAENSELILAYRQSSVCLQGWEEDLFNIARIVAGDTGARPSIWSVARRQVARSHRLMLLLIILVTRLAVVLCALAQDPEGPSPPAASTLAIAATHIFGCPSKKHSTESAPVSGIVDICVMAPRQLVSSILKTQVAGSVAVTSFICARKAATTPSPMPGRRRTWGRRTGRPPLLTKAALRSQTRNGRWTAIPTGEDIPNPELLCIV